MPQDYVIKTSTSTYRIRVPDGMDQDKALSLAVATNPQFATEYGALQAHQKTMISDQMKPFEWSGPTVPRPPGGGEEATLAEGAMPGLEGLSTIGTAGTLKQNPVAAIRSLIGAGALGYGGAKGGEYLFGQPGKIIGGLAGTLAGGYAGARGLPIGSKGTIAERLLGMFSHPTPVEPEPLPFPPEATSSGTPSMVSPSGRTSLAPPPKPVAPVATSPFGNATSSGVPSMSSPAGTSTLAPPPVMPKVSRATAAGASPKSSILSRGTTMVDLTQPPDPTDSLHSEIIQDYQTRSGADKRLPDGTVQPGLRTMAKAGDQFAAFVLRHFPRP